METLGLYSNETIEQFIDRLVKELNPLPSITPKREKGKWLVENNPSGQYSFCYCSNCNSYYTIDRKDEMNYCPNCGVDMRESEE